MKEQQEIGRMITDEIEWAKRKELFFHSFTQALAKESEAALGSLIESPFMRESNELGWTPLILAVHAGDAGSVQVIAARSDPNHKDANGTTALMWAAASGSLDIVNLLAPISDLTARDKMGLSALMWAVTNRQASCVMAICAVATIEVLSLRGKDGLTSLEKAHQLGDWEMASILLRRSSELEREEIASVAGAGKSSNSGLSL